MAKKNKSKPNKKDKLFEYQELAKSQTCRKCGIHGCTVDHIIPVAFLLKLGLQDVIYNDVDNFDFLCRRCNYFKGDNFDHTNPKTVPLLIKYVHAYSLEVSPTASLL